MIEPVVVDVETRVVIVIPNGHIPSERPLRPRIWGGGVFPSHPDDPSWPHPPEKRGFAAPELSKKAQEEPDSAEAKEERKKIAKAKYEYELGVMQRYRARRVYTDDSDLFLCCLHSGWVTWKGARRAKRKGRDLRVEENDVPIVMVKAAAGFNASASERKEEVVVRFLGGRGERCGIERNVKGLTEAEDLALAAAGEVKSSKASGKRPRDSDDTEDEDEDEFDDMNPDDDDGRGLMSASWGTTHDGAAIEILNAQFVERGVSSGRRSRAQRLREYAERRAAVLVEAVPTHPPMTPSL
ncbi:YTP1 [Coprinopsis cinerea AmutBmut pab1-1]|nr:YTP1 [Coprinopsis cinerea AmutBmut pab1-1]